MVTGVTLHGQILPLFSYKTTPAYPYLYQRPANTTQHLVADGLSGLVDVALDLAQGGPGRHPRSGAGRHRSRPWSWPGGPLRPCRWPLELPAWTWTAVGRR